MIIKSAGKRISLTLALLALSMIILLAGCSGGGPSQAAPTPSSSPAPQPSDAPDTDTPPSDSAPPTPEADAIQSIIDKMSLEEKIGQMIIGGVDGTSADPQTERMIREQHVGGVIFFKNNLADPASVISFVNQLKEWNSGNAAPILLSVDQEGGRVSRFPGWEPIPPALTIGDTGNPDLATELGVVLGEGVQQMGMNMNFAPVLDINSNPGNPVIGDRSFGADVEQVTGMGIEVMKQIAETGVIPVVKHFPGHGDTDTDSHLDLPVIHKTENELDELELKPFEEAIREGADVVMVAHILFPALDAELPSSLSKEIITGQLRGKLGFEGVVITDDMTMGAIANQYGMGEAAVLSIEAGTDLLLVAHQYENIDNVINTVKQSVQDGTLTEERIEESVRRILELKAKYGLEDTPVQAPDLSALNERITGLSSRAANP